MVPSSVLVLSRAALAADTVETFDHGAFDVEVYADTAAGAEVVLGAGLLPGLALTANGSLDRAGAAGLGLCLFGTPLDTDHLDLDLLAATDGATFTPGLELNLDADPDMGSLGAYLRLEAPLAIEGASPDLALNPGLYWTVAEGRMVLLEVDTLVGGERYGLALGGNGLLSEALELLTQARLDGGPGAWEMGLMAGLIASL